MKYLVFKNLPSIVGLLVDEEKKNQLYTSD